MTTTLTRKTLLKIVIACITLLILMAVPFSPVQAQGRQEVCEGIGGCADRATSDLQVAGVIQTALNLISIVIGIAGVVMVMLGGFRYITSGGDSSKTASAQNTILWALVGLVIAATAQIIVRFVLTKV